MHGVLPEWHTVHRGWDCELTVVAFRRRVLIVEDDPFLGSLMTDALEHAGLETRLATSAVAAKRTLSVFDPDVAVVDIDLGDGPSGIDFVHVLVRFAPGVAAVLLSKHPDCHTAGLSGVDIPDGVAYLRKSLIHDTSVLVEAIEEVVRGTTTRWRHDLESKGTLDRLTRAQRETLHLMALGLSNAEIAMRRNVSLSSVEQRVSEIFKALEIDASVGLVPRVVAIRHYIAESGLPAATRA